MSVGPQRADLLGAQYELEGRARPVAHGVGVNARALEGQVGVYRHRRAPRRGVGFEPREGGTHVALPAALARAEAPLGDDVHFARRERRLMNRAAVAPGDERVAQVGVDEMEAILSIAAHLFEPPVEPQPGAGRHLVAGGKEALLDARARRRPREQLLAVPRDGEQLFGTIQDDQRAHASSSIVPAAMATKSQLRKPFERARTVDPRPITAREPPHHLLQHAFGAYVGRQQRTPYTLIRLPLQHPCTIFLTPPLLIP